MLSVAPGTSAHDVPSARQRRHWNARLVLEPLFQRPRLALRTAPSSAAPEIEGGCWLVGTARPDALPDPAKAARPSARVEPTERIAQRPIRRSSYPLLFAVHHILIEN